MNTQVLFVCLGNICRSPMAEGIFNELLISKGYNGNISCDSAGTGNYHIGHLPDVRTLQVCENNQITLTHRCRQIEKADLENFDLIIGMDQNNVKNINLLDPQGKYHAKIHLMSAFGTKKFGTEVPDPYYGTTKDFELVYDQLLDACEGLIKHITKKEAH